MITQPGKVFPLVSVLALVLAHKLKNFCRISLTYLSDGSQVPPIQVYWLLRPAKAFVLGMHPSLASCSNNSRLTVATNGKARYEDIHVRK
jgi:hypothetical protein